MNGLDTLLTVADQVAVLPDQCLRQGITILRSVVHLALLEEEGRREQALLVRQALEGNEAAVPQTAGVTGVGQPGSQPDQTWATDFRAGDPDRQHITASEATGLITAFETIMNSLQYTNVTERQLVLEVRAAISRVKAMGNHEPPGEESTGGA